MRYFFIYISLISFSLFSQNVILEIDTNNLRIGEQFNLTMKVYDIAEESIVWPSTETLFQDFDFIKASSPSLYLGQDTYVYKNYLFTAFDTGKFSIDSIMISSVLNDTIFSNSVDFHFIAMPLDTTSRFFDIKPPKKIPFLAKELLFYLPYLILILLVIVLLIIFFTDKESRTLVSSRKPSLPIDVYFLNKLNTLENKNYLENKKYKEFYTELSEIFRGYLELRFNILALESTTYELKGFLDNLKINEKWFNNFFRNNDIVKFAKGIPSKKESELFLDNMKDFIKQHGVVNQHLSKEIKTIN